MFVGLQPAAEIPQMSLSPVARMSTMPASHGHNEACCNIPPIVSDDYVAKGLYEELGNYKSCKWLDFSNA